MMRLPEFTPIATYKELHNKAVALELLEEQLSLSDLPIAPNIFLSYSAEIKRDISKVDGLSSSDFDKMITKVACIALCLNMVTCAYISDDKEVKLYIDSLLNLAQVAVTYDKWEFIPKIHDLCFRGLQTYDWEHLSPACIALAENLSDICI